MASNRAYKQSIDKVTLIQEQKPSTARKQSPKRIVAYFGNNVMLSMMSSGTDDLWRL